MSPTVRARATGPLVLLLVFCAGFAVAETDEGLDPDAEALLPPPREQFTVGVSELSTQSLAGDRGFVGTTFPRLLYEELRSIDERLISPTELEAYLDARRKRALSDAGAELTAAVDARDALLFAADAGSNGDTRQRVVAAREEFDLLSSIRFRAEEPARRPVAFPLELGDETLLPPIDFTAAGAASRADLVRITEKHDLDYLLFGRAEEQAGYIIVDIYGYHRFRDTVSLLSSTIRLAEEIGLDARPVADELAEALLGRPWSTLRVRSEHSNVAIRVEGELAGLGDVTLRYLLPGTYEIRATRSGFAPESRAVTLVSGETTDVDIALDERVVREVMLRSSPSNANVYVDSIWVGTTPLSYEFPLGSSVVQLRRDGFLESRFVVDGQSPPSISRALLSAQIDWTDELREQRDEFYRALGFFVVSVPVTMLLWGGYQNVLGTRASPDLPSLPPEEDLRLVQLGNTLYWSALGGLAVNVGLFVNVLFALFDYVAVGEGAHNQ